jgi:hypothetical protein
MIVVIGLVKGLGASFVMEGIDRQTPFTNDGEYQAKSGIPVVAAVLIKISIDKSQQAKYEQCIFSIMSRHRFFSIHPQPWNACFRRMDACRALLRRESFGAMSIRSKRHPDRLPLGIIRHGWQADLVSIVDPDSSQAQGIEGPRIHTHLNDIGVALLVNQRFVDGRIYRIAMLILGV